MTSSTRRVSAPVSTPVPAARRRYGSSRLPAYQLAQSPAPLISATGLAASAPAITGPGTVASAATVTVSPERSPSGRVAMNPGHGLPNRAAPAACSTARSRPNCSAACSSGACCGSQVTASVEVSQPRTSGTRHRVGVGQPAQPARLGLEDAAQVLAGGLGEGHPAVGQRDLVVGPLMLRPGRADLAHLRAGDPLQPPGEFRDPPGEFGGPDGRSRAPGAGPPAAGPPAAGSPAAGSPARVRIPGGRIPGSGIPGSAIPRSSVRLAHDSPVPLAGASGPVDGRAAGTCHLGQPPDQAAHRALDQVQGLRVAGLRAAVGVGHAAVPGIAGYLARPGPGRTTGTASAAARPPPRRGPGRAAPPGC